MFSNSNIVIIILAGLLVLGTVLGIAISRQEATPTPSVVGEREVVTATASPITAEIHTFTPSGSSVPTLTPTPLPQENCEGSGWVYHTVGKNDSLSYYASYLATALVFTGLSPEQRQQLIKEANPNLDFDPLVIGEIVCLPANVLPFPEIVDTSSGGIGGTDNGSGNIVLETNGGGNNAGGNVVVVNNGGGNNAGNGGGGGGNGGNGGGGGVEATTPPVVPSELPIIISASHSCQHGNSGDTTFTLRNSGSTTVSISWQIKNGSLLIAGGEANLSPGVSSNVWSNNTKDKNYSIVANVGAVSTSSGENCG